MERITKKYRSPIMALIIIGVAVGVFAANFEVKLPDTDATSAFQVQDSDSAVLMEVESDGDVGIGTTTPVSKLEVNGTVTATAFSGGGILPSGMIAFFASSCPSGWTEYTALRGRFLVGTPSGGTISGTVGTVLADLGTHTITDVPAHTHTVDPPSATTDDPGTHTHSLGDGTWDTSANTTGATRFPDMSGGTGPTASVTTGSEGSHAHTVDIDSVTSDSTGSASVDVTNPYIQLTACQKD